MADFSVPNFGGLERAAASYGDMLTRIAAMRQRERENEEEDRTRAVLGVSTGEIGRLVPEAMDQISAATSGPERADLIAKAAQMAQARGMQEKDMLARIQAIQSTTATPGADPSALVASQQNALVSSGLPPDVIASLQSSLGSASAMGSADRGRVQEDRGYRNAEQDEARRYEAGVRAEDRQYGTSQQLAAEGRQVSRQIAAEERRAAQGDLEARRRYAVELGAPWNSKSPPEWPSINSAALYKLENDGKPQPKEIRAANDRIIAEVMATNKNKPRSGDITDESVMNLARQFNTRAVEGGADVVIVPTITTENGMFSWADVTLEALPWQMAKAEIGRIREIAEQYPGSEADKYMDHIYNLATTTDSPSLRAVFTSQVTPEQAEAIKKTQEAEAAAQKAADEEAAAKAERAKTAATKGKKVELKDRGGNPTGKVVYRDPVGKLGRSSVKGAPQKGGR